MSMTRKLWIGIAVLALLSPLGIIIPKWFGAEGTWGEWGLDEIERIAGFVPKGMKRIADLWKAPLPDYALPIGNKGIAAEGIGYALSAVIGIVVIVAVMYGITKLLGHKGGSE